MDAGRIVSVVTDRWRVIAASGVVIATIAAVRSLSKSWRKQNTWPKDTVVLHQFGRGPWCPSISNYPIKLETYLRWANIPYVNDLKGGSFSKKGKIPWISYNNEDMADTSFIIEHLNQKFGVNLNQHLDDTEKATALAFQRLCEDSLYWNGATYRWMFTGFMQEFLRKEFGFGWLMAELIVRRLRKQPWYQGMGRHSEDEIMHITFNNLTALSNFIGNKQYLMGDEPCEQDCTVFGILVHYIWHVQGTPFENTMKDKYPSLVAYCNRMKDRFWPDWDQCITHGYTRKPTK